MLGPVGKKGADGGVAGESDVLSTVVSGLQDDPRMEMGSTRHQRHGTNKQRI